MKTTHYLIVTLLTLMTFSVNSKPEPLNIDESIKAVSHKYIRSAHLEINHSLSVDQVRFSILQAALSDRRGKWLLESDDDSSVTLRRDLAGDIIYVQVEYDEQYVQLKYVDRESAFTCRKNIEGICYKNEDIDFYGYFKFLRNLIATSLKNYGEK